MKKHTGLIAAATAALLISGACLQAATQKVDGYPLEKGVAIQDYWSFSNMPDTESLRQMHSSVAAALESERQRMHQAPKEVKDALRYSAKAMKALRRDDDTTAGHSLEEAERLFEIALTNDPDLERVPVAQTIVMNDLVITPEAAAKAVRQAGDALAAHRTQEARSLLEPLHEELCVVTQVLPMHLYPKAAKAALAKLKAGDREGAFAALHNAFETLETEEAVLPLPLLKARAFAQTAAAMTGHDPSARKVILEHTRDELTDAVLLGYVSEADPGYKAVDKRLEAVEKAFDRRSGVNAPLDGVIAAFDNLLAEPANGLRPVS